MNIEGLLHVIYPKPGIFCDFKPQYHGIPVLHGRKSATAKPNPMWASNSYQSTNWIKAVTVVVVAAAVATAAGSLKNSAEKPNHNITAHLSRYHLKPTSSITSSDLQAGSTISVSSHASSLYV